MGYRQSTAIAIGALGCLLGCGARTSLDGGDGGSGASETNASTGPSGANVSGTSSTGGSCVDGTVQECGSSAGICKPGKQICHANAFGPCVGQIGAKPEVCNGIDDNCDGQIDDGFHIGEACAGTGTDQCLDGLMTCDGCKKSGPEKVEICNGVDDNCNGSIDSDCETGDCNPTLLVTGSTPSSPNCVDFPVTAGSLGAIEYPCAGGPVTATLGGVSFSDRKSVV